MKKYLSVILLIISFSATNAAAQSASAPFKDWQKDSKITSTFISKEMIEISPDVKIGNTTLKSLGKKITQVEIYSNDKPVHTATILGRNLKEQAVNIAIKHEYELLLKHENKDKDFLFYAKKIGGGSYISDLIMIEHDSSVDQPRLGRCTVIRLAGRFTITDIQNVFSLQ